MKGECPNCGAAWSVTSYDFASRAEVSCKRCRERFIPFDLPASPSSDTAQQGWGMFISRLVPRLFVWGFMLLLLFGFSREPDNLEAIRSYLGLLCFVVLTAAIFTPLRRRGD